MPDNLWHPIDPADPSTLPQPGDYDQNGLVLWLCDDGSVCPWPAWGNMVAGKPAVAWRRIPCPPSQTDSETHATVGQPTMPAPQQLED